MSDRYDDMFKALADGHRRQIVAALRRGPKVAGELARLVGLAPNAVSFHLKWLRSAGLVSVRREGRYLRYHGNERALADWQARVRKLLGTGKVTARAGGSARAPREREDLHEELPLPGSERPPEEQPPADLPTELL